MKNLSKVVFYMLALLMLMMALEYTGGVCTKCTHIFDEITRCLDKAIERVSKFGNCNAGVGKFDNAGPHLNRIRKSTTDRVTELLCFTVVDDQANPLLIACLDSMAQVYFMNLQKMQPHWFRTGRKGAGPAISE